MKIGLHCQHLACQYILKTMQSVRTMDSQNELTWRFFHQLTAQN